MNDVGLVELRAAILRQAARDYEDALKDNNRAKAQKLEQFFKSGWGELLSGGLGDYIISECKKRVERK